MPNAPGARQRLAELMDERRRELRLRWQDVAETGGLSLKTLHSVRTGTAGIAPLTERGIEVGLRWEAGSVGAVLTGGEPQPARVPPLAAVPAAPLSFERGQDDLFPDMDPATRAEVDARAPGIREAVIAAAIKGPLTGAAIFPDPVEAERWDRLTGIGQGMEPGKGFTPWQMVQFMAIGRINDERHRAGNQPRRVRGVLIPI